METRLIWIAVAAGLVGGCASKDACGSEVCSAEQRCSASKVCVTDTPPTLNVDSPSDGLLIGGQTVELRGTALDDTEALKVEVSVDSGAWIPLVIGNAGSFERQLTVPTSDEATSKIVVRAVDQKGREVKVVRSVKVDNVAPVCALNTPLEGAVLTQTGSVGVSLLASDGSLTLMNPRVSTDGARTFAPATKAGADYTFDWMLTAENGVAHQVVFRVEDGSGHTCEATVNVTVDNVAPAVGFASPGAGALLGPAFFSSGGTFAGTSSDGTRSLRSVSFSFADGGWLPAAVSGNQWTVSITPPVGADYVARTATVVAVDLAGNTASATREVQVDVVPPMLSITAPASGARLNAANFPSGNAVALAWTLTDGDPQPSLGLALSDGGVQSPPVVTTAPTDNPKTYQPVLVARDRAGNTATASVTFTVDRVAPTVTLFPANNTRMHVGPAKAVFSEAMMASGSGLVLNPTATGTWTTATEWTSAALEKDRVYTAAGGAVTDLHGNPVTSPTPTRFHTETWIPASGATLATGYSQVLLADADPEGVLNIVARESVSGFSFAHWLELSPSMGTAVNLGVVEQGSEALVSWCTTQSDLTSRRLAGMADGQTNPQILTSVRFKVGSAAVASTIADAFIPTPPFAGEGTGLAEYGFIRGGNYDRGSVVLAPVGLSKVNAIHVGTKRWEIVEYPSTGLKSQTFGCYPSILGNAPPNCEMRAVKYLSGGAPTARAVSAMSTGCSAQQVYDATATSTTLMGWQPECGSFQRPACFPDSMAAGSPKQLVADRSNDGTFYSLELGVSTQVRKLVLGGNCTGTWVNVGAAMTFPTPARLVVIRGNPGLLYADAAGNLKFVTP